MKIIFWLSFLGAFYAYFGYPMALYVLGKLFPAEDKGTPNTENLPTLSIIIPVYNEAKVIKEKLSNISNLDYPKDKYEILVISDGSDDGTKEIVLNDSLTGLKFYELPKRSGKAAALNMGLSKAAMEIIVFTDASIMLDKNSLKNIVHRFREGNIGCVSGEDHIKDASGEGLYGKYELYIRNQESRIHSIVGASGSFYAQRKDLCEPFVEGMAPDFLSVLNTVEKGCRAVTEPNAFGTMTSVKSNKDEFNRKVRTSIRGMTTLFCKKEILNPFKHGVFSLELISHKLMRWFVPLFLLSLLLTNVFMLNEALYALIFLLQIAFYVLGMLASMRVGSFDQKTLGKIPLYFITVNAAILIAWFKYLTGVRQEIWSPSKREQKSSSV